MKEYSFTEETAKKVIITQAFSRIPIIVIATIGGLYIADIQNGDHIFSNKIVVITTFVIFIIAGSIGLLIGIKNGTKALMQNKYILTDNYIERFTPSGKIVRLEFSKIDKYQVSKKGLLIKSSSEKILVPSGLDQFDELSTSVLEKLR